MKYRRLGKTGLEVSVVGIGTWQLGGEWGKEYTQAETNEVIDAGRETGINLIDTAECYGDHTSERLVGGAIQGDREKWIVATKFGHGFTGFLKRDQLWSADDVKKQLEDSLKALETDYIDLLSNLTRCRCGSRSLSNLLQPPLTGSRGQDASRMPSGSRCARPGPHGERIQKEEIPEGMPMANWALAWCLKNPAVTCVIPGCKNPDQVRSNAAATDIEL
jgi:aryl-alcohol dehydrogenase-like predicted oxidoreductase